MKLALGWSDFEDVFSPYLDFEWYGTDAEGEWPSCFGRVRPLMPLAVFLAQPTKPWRSSRAYSQRRPAAERQAGGRLLGGEATHPGAVCLRLGHDPNCPLPRQPYRIKPRPAEPLLSTELPADARLAGESAVLWAGVLDLSRFLEVVHRGRASA